MTFTKGSFRMTHSAVLKRAEFPTIDTLVRRILKVWGRATASDIEAGARWYDEAGQIATGLANGDVSIEQAAAVIAALSPRTSWTRNVAGATALVNQGPTAARRLGCLARNVETAQRAKRTGLAAINGPKTSRFALNILGDREAVTVDVWACRVAGVDETKLGRVGVYDAIEHAYRLAARRVGVDPAAMQATTWIVARGGRAS
jgi:hypothetical protein